MQEPTGSISMEMETLRMNQQEMLGKKNCKRNEEFLLTDLLLDWTQPRK